MSCTGSQPNPIAPVTTEASASPLLVQLLNGPFLAAWNQATVLWIAMIWCVYTRHRNVSTKYINISNTTDTLKIALCPSQALSLKIQPMHQQRNTARGLQEISLCQTWRHGTSLSYHLVPWKLPEAERYLYLSLIYFILLCKDYFSYITINEYIYEVLFSILCFEK